jgi:hypothetical protein
MKPGETLEGFVHYLRLSRLLSPAVINRLLERFQTSPEDQTAAKFAEKLISRGYLTRYHCKKLHNAQWKGFFWPDSSVGMVGEPKYMLLEPLSAEHQSPDLFGRFFAFDLDTGRRVILNYARDGQRAKLETVEDPQRDGGEEAFQPRAGAM